MRNMIYFWSLNSTDRLKWHFSLFQTLGFTSALCVLDLQDWKTQSRLGHRLVVPHTLFTASIDNRAHWQQTVNTMPLLNNKLGIFKVFFKLDLASWPLLKILCHKLLALLQQTVHTKTNMRVGKTRFTFLRLTGLDWRHIIIVL